MATQAQIDANQANAQHSTGPRSPEGKATSSANHCKHGLTGHFRLLPWEDQTRYYALLDGLHEEHQPATITEQMLVEKMAQHFWISQRAQLLADVCMDPEKGVLADEKQFALFMRYQTSHERGFHKCLSDLLKLRAEKRKERLDEAALSHRAEDSSKIGFESQKREEADEARKEANQNRREAAEKRKQELHQWAVLLAEAKLDHQQLQNSLLGSPIPERSHSQQAA